MKPLPSLEQLKKDLPNYKKALVLLSSTPNIDTVASALGLAVTLKKKGVDTQVASTSDMRVEFSRLVGVDDVRKKIGNRNLIVSFDYSEDKVEKVSYNISEDGKKFNLVISPKTGATPLDPATVDFDYAGAESDLTFMIGVSNFTELGSLYEEERNAIEGSHTVAITLFPAPTFAKTHLDATGTSSLSEFMVSVCQGLDLPLDQDSAGNFLFGLDSITGGLSSPTVTADTFETVAVLMRAGARRQPIGQHGSMTQNQMPWQPQAQTTVPTSQPTQVTIDEGNNNPFAAALSKSDQTSSLMPAGYSATGELKG